MMESKMDAVRIFQADKSCLRRTRKMILKSIDIQQKLWVWHIGISIILLLISVQNLDPQQATESSGGIVRRGTVVIDEDVVITAITK